MIITSDFEVAEPVEKVWRFFGSIPQVASCLPGAELTDALVEVDNAGVDGSVNALAALVGRTSNRLREMETGFVRNYALSMLTGALLIVGAFLAVQLGWLA